MPGKILCLLSVFCYLLLALSSPVSAQIATIAPATNQPTCDLCGWCNPQTNPKPPGWDKCHACLFDTRGQESTGSYWTVFGCLSTKPEAFVKSMLAVIFGIAGGIAFLAVLTGSAIVLTSSGYPDRLQTGKDLIVSSIFGLMLIIFSVFLLRVVGFEILRIPGFG